MLNKGLGMNPRFKEHLFAPRGGVPFDSMVMGRSLCPVRKARTFASRFWGFHLPVPAAMSKAASFIQREASEDIFFQGEIAGNLVVNMQGHEHQEAAEEQRQHAKPLLKGFGIRAPMDDLSCAWLVCDEAGFHEDFHMALDEVFCIWHVAGPAKAVDFPSLGFGVVMNQGDALLFDGLQPHGVRRSDKAGMIFECSDEAARLPSTMDDLTVFYSLDIPLTSAIQRKMKIRPYAQAHCLNSCLWNYKVDPLDGSIEAQWG